MYVRISTALNNVHFIQPLSNPIRNWDSVELFVAGGSLHIYARIRSTLQKIGIIFFVESSTNADTVIVAMLSADNNSFH
jgi:hypothetical protein